MPTNSNVCGQRIDYENHTRESLPEHQANLSEVAYSEVEDTLAIIAEIQNERTNEDSDIAEPLTLTQIRTILEVGVSLQRSLTILEAIQDGSEGAL
jgi:hypothetical protein